LGEVVLGYFMHFRKFIFCILLCSSLFCGEVKKNYVIDFVKKNKIFIAPSCAVLFLFAYYMFKNYGKAGKSPVEDKKSDKEVRNTLENQTERQNNPINQTNASDNVFVVDEELRKKFGMDYNEFCASEDSTSLNNLSISDQKSLEFTQLVYSSDKKNGLSYDPPSPHGKDQGAWDRELMLYRKFFILKGWLNYLPNMIQVLYKDILKIKVPASDKCFGKNTIEDLLKNVEILYRDVRQSNRKLLPAKNNLFPFICNDSMLYARIRTVIYFIEKKYYKKYKDSTIVWLFNFKSNGLFEEFVKNAQSNNYYDNSKFTNKVKNFDQAYQDFLLNLKKYQENNEKMVYLSQDDVNIIEDFKKQYDNLNEDFDKIKEARRDVEWDLLNQERPIKKDIAWKEFPNYSKLLKQYQNFVCWLKDAQELFKKYESEKFVLPNSKKIFYSKVESSIEFYKARIDLFKQKKIEDNEIYGTVFIDSFEDKIGSWPQVFYESFEMMKDSIKDMQTCLQCKKWEGSSSMVVLNPHKKFICFPCRCTDPLAICPVCRGSLNTTYEDGKEIIECDQIEEAKPKKIDSKKGIVQEEKGNIFVVNTNEILVLDKDQNPIVLIQ